MAPSHTLQAPDTITAIGPLGPVPTGASGAFNTGRRDVGVPVGRRRYRDFGKKISSRGQRGAID